MTGGERSHINYLIDYLRLPLPQASGSITFKQHHPFKCCYPLGKGILIIKFVHHFVPDLTDCHGILFRHQLLC